jgi:hypothetical protein
MSQTEQNTENKEIVNPVKLDKNNYDYNNSQYTYALLAEFNQDQAETWYYFIRYQGNEENIMYLKKQLETIEWICEDGLSAFDLITEYLVSEKTAKEMTKVDINSQSFHKKFDGKLEKIDLMLKDKEKNKKKMKKVNRVLGFGQIEDYVDKEDLDPEDLVTDSDCSGSGSGSGSGSEDDSGSENSSGSNSGSNSDSEREKKEKKEKTKKTGKLPGAVKSGGQKIPLHILAKRRR